MNKKSIFNWVLLVIVLALVYVCFLSIYSDIEFDAAKKEREEAVISRLMKIRDAEEKFRASHANQYCGDIDSLVSWVRDSMAVEKVIKEGELTDDQLEAGLTESEAVAQGIIRRDTVWVKASEMLGITNADSLKICPVGREGGQIAVRKSLNYNSKSQEWDQVCEIRANLDDYLDGLDSKKIKNLKSELEKRNKTRDMWIGTKQPDGTTAWIEDENEQWYGLRMGDLDDSNNKMAGNWE